jgi:hypothetical protein
VIRRLGPGVAFVLAGCATGPLTVRVETPDASAAALEVRLLEGEAVAQPPECDTPCAIKVEPDTVHRLTLRAAGYYPARVDLNYDQILRSSTAARDPNRDVKEVRLVIPLMQRTAAAAQHPDGIAP